MSFIRIGSFGKTSKLPATATPAAFTQSGPYQRFVVQTTVDCHLAHTTGANATFLKGQGEPFEAGQTDFLLLGGFTAAILLYEGDVLSFVKDTGAEDGDIYITPSTQA